MQQLLGYDTNGTSNKNKTVLKSFKNDNFLYFKTSVQLLSCVQLFVTPGTAAYQAFLPISHHITQIVITLGAAMSVCVSHSIMSNSV